MPSHSGTEQKNPTRQSGTTGVASPQCHERDLLAHLGTYTADACGWTLNLTFGFICVMNLKSSIRVAAYLLVYLGVPAVITLELTNETVTSVLVIVYIMLVIPIGVLQGIDFFRTNDGNTTFSRIFNALFRVPLALFGLVCLISGIAIIGWVVYNVFVERQKEYSGPSFVLGLGSFGVGLPLVLYGWFTLRSAVRRKGKVTLSSEDQDEFDREEDDEEHPSKTSAESNIQSKK
jgi:hypothetical protein